MSSSSQHGSPPPGEPNIEQGTLAATHSLENDGGALALLRDVEVELTLEIGRRRLRIAEVLKLTNGHTLELTKAAGEPLDIYVNGRLLGRGEAIVLGDHYGVRITELASGESGGRA